MRRMAAVVVAVVLLATGAGRAVAADGDGTYTNPVWPGDFADPFVLRVGDSFYAYSTASGAGNMPVLRSSDLAAWERVGDAMPQLASWVGPGRNWAPGVIQLAGSFVAYYTALNAREGHQCIGLAVSSTPEGPFVDERGAPLICQLDRAGSIDASPFLDAAGDPWLTWKSEGHFPGRPALIWTQRLSADGRALVGAATPVLGADQWWELGIVEAPSMLVAGGRHLLFYSGSRWDGPDYAVSYAECAGPAGPCRKPNPLPLMIRNAAVGGPGGQELFQDTTGAIWMAYHGWTMPTTSYPDGRRSLRLERVQLVDGRPVVVGPSTSPLPLTRAVRIAGVDRYATAALFSARTFEPGVPVAFVASGASFADALAAAPAAAVGRGPVLLVDGRGVPAATADELRRLRPGRVVVVGAAARRPDVLAALASITGATVTPLLGLDRYATSAVVSAAAFAGGAPVAYLATGRAFPDALAAGAAGARQGGPVLLASDRLPASVAAELRRLRPSEVVVLGGRAAVPDTVVDEVRRIIPSVRRVAGADRYATAAALSSATYPAGGGDAIVATGQSFADALSAGPAARPVLLVDSTVRDVVTRELDRIGGGVTVLGGTHAVSERTLLQL